MSDNRSRFVVTPDWVEKQLGAPEFRVVDASWYLPAQKRNGALEYSEGHVPGAVFYDQDAIADTSSPLPHTLPTPEFFAESVGRLGIADRDTIVVYDGVGFFSAPRVWWLFRLFGAERVYVMDGGLARWKAEGRPLETDLAEPRPAVFTPRLDAVRVADLDPMKAIVAAGSMQIADARGAARFTAEEAEPRPGLRSGHMPGAKNLPSSAFSENGNFKDLAALQALFEAEGIDLSKPVVTTCGSGVTAAIITLALESLGHRDNRLYDGSWTEWGGQPDTPVVTGKA